MFPPHDPYHILIPNLAEYWGYNIQLTTQSNHPQPRQSCSNCNEITDQLRILLNAWKPFLQQVRNAYNRVPTTFDYNSRYQKGIYMLAYFPFYIEPIYYSLENFHEQIFLQNKNKLTISVLGGGPLPELLGIVKLIDEKKNDIQNISVKIFDKYESWKAEFESCTQPLVSNYFKGGIFYDQFQVDIIDIEDSIIDNITNTDIIILQNTINDIPLNKYSSLKNSLLKIWNSLSTNSLLIIIDLNFNEVRSFMNQIQIELANLGGNIISGLNVIPIEHRPNIPFCSHLDRLLFSDQDGFRARRKVNYYRFVIKK